jgi:DinB superfamily
VFSTLLKIGKLPTFVQTIFVNTQLETLLQQLEQQRAALINELKSVNPEQLNQSLNGKWSISQIAGHLIQAERMSVGYMAKKINAIQEVGNTGLWGEVKLLVFMASQRLPLKYKAPKNLGDNPPAYIDVATLEHDWNEARQALKVFLETVPDWGLRKQIYKHPVMGRCSVLHALKFFREHIIHHNPQIKRQL